MLMSPLPHISESYSLLQHDESQKENQPLALGFSSDLTSFFATSNHPSHHLNQQSNTTSYSQRNNFDSKKVSSSLSCKYCKKLGHTVDKCYMLHGFPDDFKFSKNKRLHPVSK